jgi:imidazole glycerol-phosphate synthase subunit HisH
VIALIDYGAGNLTSVRKGLAAAGGTVYSPAASTDLERASAIVVPGVGHFSATAVLTDQWRQAVRERIERDVPLLGICLGMQWLFEGSEEAAGVPGLGIFPGRCTKIVAVRPLKVPHVGWNTLLRIGTSSLLEGVADGVHVYFTHTFAAPITADTVASTTHDVSFASAVERGYVFGLQFHPEKSADAGLQMLRNFVRLVHG